MVMSCSLQQVGVLFALRVVVVVVFATFSYSCVQFKVCHDFYTRQAVYVYVIRVGATSVAVEKQ